MTQMHTTISRVHCNREMNFKTRRYCVTQAGFAYLTVCKNSYYMLGIARNVEK